MILGIGCDVVQIPRIENLIQRFNNKFFNRIFSQREMSILKYGNTQSHYVAKRFAAKEAFAKAIGHGIGSIFKFADIEIFNDIYGQPYFSEYTISLIRQHQNVRCLVSLSDDYPIAIAFVTLFKV